MIKLRTALVLYAVLIALALASLKGKALYLVLIIVGALAVKSVLYWYRERMDSRPADQPSPTD